MATANATPGNKSVADAVAAYESLKPLWRRARAVCSGEKHVKAYDSYLDTQSFQNLLIPFSPSMTQQQYEFYKAEAEFPGIVAQFVKMSVGGLLRKKPVLQLPDSVPEEAYTWLMDELGQDDAPLTSVLDAALYEELQTSRPWIFVEHPKVDPDATADDLLKVKPYPIIWPAESVINWTRRPGAQGKAVLSRVIVRGYEQVEGENEFHPSYVDTVRVHELVGGYYQVRVYRPSSEALSVPFVAGKQQAPRDRPAFELVETITDITARGERLTEIPAWPLNGLIDPIEPFIAPFVDKEIALYNKVSRRNHLLYGASTYTPVISSDIGDEDFQAIVNSGLGTWLHLRQGDTASVLETPTDALQDMDRAIAASVEEMAKMGIRMLTAETNQSGVALDLRNASQNAQLGTLNIKVSNTIRQVFKFMIWWRYGIRVPIDQIQFQLSSDFNPTPLGADWLRLATEWYQQNLIPRSVWLHILKQNDMLDADYDDDTGKQEMTDDLDMQLSKQKDFAEIVGSVKPQQKKQTT